MTTQVCFGIISDPHITLPHTLWNHPNRFHLVEWSIATFEHAVADLISKGIEFLLLPGDLTQHGEPENHQWLADRLRTLPIPAYVIPGNHDVPTPESLDKFKCFYQPFGYQGSPPEHLCYITDLCPGIKLIGLNSNWFNAAGEQVGRIEADQLDWLTETLHQYPQDLLLVMVHHNVVEHLPNQSRSTLGKRYMLENADFLCSRLYNSGVQVVFTGHLHVQDVAYHDRYRLYDITTGSTVSFPHPYRLLTYTYDTDPRKGSLEISSFLVESIPLCPDLQHFSREWMGARSGNFVRKLLTAPPLNLSPEESETLLPQLRYLWADVAQGDASVQFPDFPPEAQEYFEAFTDRPPADNHCTLLLGEK